MSTTVLKIAPQVTIFRKICGNSQESFLGICENSQESFTKIRWKCPQLFQGISRNQVQWISCNPFWGNSHYSIQGIFCNQFQGIPCYQFCRKTGENVDEKNSSEPIPGNFVGTISKIFSKIPQEYLVIFPAYSWVNSLTRT